MTMGKISLFGIGAVLSLAAAVPVNAQQQGQNPLPQGEGRDLVAVACTQCHPLTPILNSRLGQAGWRNHVTNMVIRGAQLNANEADLVVRYLTASFGPSAALPPGNVTLPNGPGKELVETRCAVCHDLERAVGVKRDKSEWGMVVANMVARGAPASAEEAQTITAYLQAQFGR
jgi:cytochrome c5